MKISLDKYIRLHIEELPEEFNAEPHESIALSRLIDNMVQHIQSAQLESADIGDLIASLYSEEKTFSYLLLVENAITRLDVLEVISHTGSQNKDDEDGEDESFLKKYSINLLEKVKEGKIDLWMTSSLTLVYEALEAGFDPLDFELVLNITEMDLYIAFRGKEFRKS